MAETLWDPANLLQITDSYTALEVQCLGRAKTRHNARCPATFSGPEAAAIMAEVRRLAISPPTRVTQKELESLAKLCLCRDYHSAQLYQVSQAWKPAVARAAKLHERPDKGSATAACSQRESLLLERKKCFEILGLQNEDADLIGKLSASLSSNAQAKSMVADLQGDLAAAHTTISILEDGLRELEAELHRAKAREMELTQDSQDANRRVEETQKAERARLSGMLKLLESAKNDKGRLDAQVSVLRDELESATGRLEEERAKTKAVEESEVDLKRRLAEATEDVAQTNATLEEEAAKGRELAMANRDLERRLSEAVMDLASTQRLLEKEKTRTTALREREENWEDRLFDAYSEGGRLLSEEKTKGRALKKAKDDLGRQLNEAKVKSDRMIFEQQAKNKVLSNIKHQLRLRLAEARASSSAEVHKAMRDYDALSKSHSAALDRVRHLHSSLDLARARVQQVKNERVSAERDLHHCRAEIDPLRTTNEQLRSEIADLKSRIATFEEAASKTWRGRLRTMIHPPKPGDPTEEGPSTALLNPSTPPNFI